MRRWIASEAVGRVEVISMGTYVSMRKSKGDEWDIPSMIALMEESVQSSSPYKRNTSDMILA